MDNKMGKTYMSATVECTGTEQTLSSCIRNPHSSPQGQQSQLSFVACREGKESFNMTASIYIVDTIAWILFPMQTTTAYRYHSLSIL